MEHSKTPWKVNICDREGIWIAAEDLKYVAKTMHESNARRIVACVNACQGIRTEALEYRTFLDAQDNQIALLERQRDQLAEALEILDRELVNDPTVKPNGSIMNALRNVRDALEAAKGG